MARRVVIADQLHIQNRNFASLIEYLRLAEYESIVISHPTNLIAAFGDYAGIEAIQTHVTALDGLSRDELYALRDSGHSYFSLCKGELMCRLAPLPHWRARDEYAESEAELFNHIYHHNRAELIENLASVRFWFVRWREILAGKPTFDMALLFSGSLTYARVFSTLMKRRQGTLYICESFFTGRDYYLEARHSPIPNATALKSNGIYRSIEVPLSGPARRARQAALHAALAESANKNVKQPQAKNQRIFPLDRKVVVIFGQVLNDFSLINFGETGFHSLAFYRTCIRDILSKTDACIVFKAHPWERKKTHINGALTMETLSAEFGDADGRLRIVEDYPIGDLIREADFAIGINSQSLIEAALGGLKPIQCGGAFFGGRGFTHDVRTVDQIVELVGSASGAYLTIEEYQEAETFLMKALNEWLVPEAIATGVPRLERKLGAIRKVGNAKARSPSGTSHQVPAKSVVVVADIAGTQIQPRPGSAARKLRKLRRDPKAFFKDSRIPVVRTLARLF